MKKMICGLIFIGLGFFTVDYFSKLEKSLDDDVTQQLNRVYEEDVLDNKVREMVNKAQNLDDLVQVESSMGSLSEAKRTKLLPMISLKKSKFWFNEAEQYLMKAAEIERAVDTQVDDKALHPLTVINLEKAFALYDKSRKEVDKIKDSNDKDFNYHVNYLKGEVYFRTLEFMSNQDSAQELFNQTLTYYKYALRNRPSDINTVINIEILIKNQNKLASNMNPKARKKQMLNSKKFGVGRSSGN